MTQEEIGKIILTHYRERNYFRELPPPALSINNINRACGDTISIFLTCSQKNIERVSYTGNGCSLSIASAEILCKLLEGQSIHSAKTTIDKFIQDMGYSSKQHREIHREIQEQDGFDSHREIEALLSLRDFPIRQKCALMSWQSLRELLEKC